MKQTPDPFSDQYSTIPRVLEPEVMDTVQEAVDYNSMDHSEVNRIFVDDLLAALAVNKLEIRPVADAAPIHLLDVGTGTALIPIELCRRDVACHVTAIDLAHEMLKLARQNIDTAGLHDRIFLERVDAKAMPYDCHQFDLVMSNSIMHHIPQPRDAVVEMVRVLRPGGVLFVRDLLRPKDLQCLAELVTTYTGRENPHQQQMFRNSLHAALTLDELSTLLIEQRLPTEWVRQSSDRHWTIAGQIRSSVSR